MPQSAITGTYPIGGKEEDALHRVTEMTENLPNVDIEHVIMTNYNQWKVLNILADYVEVPKTVAVYELYNSGIFATDVYGVQLLNFVAQLILPFSDEFTLGKLSWGMKDTRSGWQPGNNKPDWNLRPAFPPLTMMRAEYIDLQLWQQY